MSGHPVPPKSEDPSSEGLSKKDSEKSRENALKLYQILQKEKKKKQKKGLHRTEKRRFFLRTHFMKY